MKKEPDEDEDEIVSQSKVEYNELTGWRGRGGEMETDDRWVPPDGGVDVEPVFVFSPGG